MSNFIQIALHLDRKLGPIIQSHGAATYGILFAVIFCETGLVVTPVLPGDTLLFAIGLFCRPDKLHPEAYHLNLILSFVTLMAAAFIGDTSNYTIGRFFGIELFRNENSKVFKKSHLTKTHEFFEKHGPKTILLARFVPIVRTFAPFVAGLGKMPYVRFISFSVMGTFAWVAMFLFGGYFIGSIPVVHENFGLAVIVMMLVTGAPLVWEVYKGFRESRASQESPAA